MGRKGMHNLSKSVRRHIRSEKARIRRTETDPQVRQQKIVELYSKFGIAPAR
jgi:hypothetical protein